MLVRTPCRQMQCTANPPWPYVAARPSAQAPPPPPPPGAAPAAQGRPDPRPAAGDDASRPVDDRHVSTITSVPSSASLLADYRDAGGAYWPVRSARSISALAVAMSCSILTGFFTNPCTRWLRPAFPACALPTPTRMPAAAPPRP